MTFTAPWAGFILLVIGLLALDLGVFHRRPHAIHAAEALRWTGFWIALSLAFSGVVYGAYEHGWLGLGADSGIGGREAVVQFITGYVVEKSLSLDNIFVIALIFRYFRVPPVMQHRVLFWGVLGAIVARGVMIGVGVLLIERFAWMTYAFGALLIVTALRLLKGGEEAAHPSELWVVRWVRRVYPVFAETQTTHFFVRSEGRRMVTPMFLCLVMVESSDVMFAVDSIPAIFAFTRDPFLIFTSNILATLGLRSLYFAIADLLDRFRYMKLSLVVLLGFVGVKMLLAHYFAIPVLASLGAIVAILAGGVGASMLAAREA